MTGIDLPESNENPIHYISDIDFRDEYIHHGSVL